MIMNRVGAEFEYEGVTYTVGAPIVGTHESEYEGLFGRITEIRDGEDKETENETPDIYCYFDPPVLPCEIKRLEEIFSDLYEQPKTLDDISLDLVIMAPEMIRPLDDLTADRTEAITYILKEDWAVDGNQGSNTAVYTDFEDAKRVMIERLYAEIESGCVARWINSDDAVVESSESSYECYLDGEYCESHYAICIEQQKLCTSERFIRELGDVHQASCQMEDFVAQVSDWDELERLTDEQYNRMIHDKRIPERFQKVLGNNDSYWEAYWLSMSEVAHEFVKLYLHEEVPEK